MKTSTSIILVIAILIGAVAAQMARSIVNRPAESTKIVVATKPLPFGAQVARDALSEVAWPSSSIPEGAFKSIDELLKDGQRVSMAPIAKNEPVLSSRVSGPGEKASLSALIEPGMRAVAVRVDDVRGVAGFIQPGDRVDVVLTRVEHSAKFDKDESYSDVLLHNVKVLAIDQQAAERQEKAQVVKAVTLEVTAEQGQKLILASGAGTLSLVLREAGGGKGADAARRVTMSDLGFDAPKASETPNAPAENSEPARSKVRILRGAKDEEVEVYHDRVAGEAN
ncbi:Flp pilus assembly protein CpaB [Methylocystis parvus]|uniref:Flp pilus assembly protein CpaB n=1 Tax=Methylocystis parvus TaxID=134 RepID=UPI003C7823A8